MKTVSVSVLKATLSEQLRHVQRGERVTVQDRGRSIAQLVPMPTLGEGDQRFADLESLGILRRGGGSLPEGFLDADLPDGAGFGLAEAVTEERAGGW